MGSLEFSELSYLKMKKKKKVMAMRIDDYKKKAKKNEKVLSSYILLLFMMFRYDDHHRTSLFLTFKFYIFVICLGLALAADQDFKTFEAAFPYVVQKLLTENSVATRKILHSVFYNNFLMIFTQLIFVVASGDDIDIF